MASRYWQAASDAPRLFHVSYEWTEQGLNFQATATRETQSFSVGVQIRGSGLTSANTAEQLGAAILKMRGGEAPARRRRWPF
jgi:hypothetical protein